MYLKSRIIIPNAHGKMTRLRRAMSPTLSMSMIAITTQRKNTPILREQQYICYWHGDF